MLTPRRLVEHIWLKPPALFNMTRCSGTTRKGSRCTLTSTSEMKDNTGRLVAQPLRRGGEYCLLHAKPFVVRTAAVQASVTVNLDLETTGVDVVRDRIVELAAMHAPADHRLAGGRYSTTAQVDPQILQERGGETATVHGISDEEIALGPSFVGFSSI
jgi:DNA polymerase III epsilon subunit-like protein